MSYIKITNSDKSEIFRIGHGSPIQIQNFVTQLQIHNFCIGFLHTDRNNNCPHLEFFAEFFKILEYIYIYFYQK